MNDHTRKITKKILLYLVSLFFLFIFIYPLYFVVISSVKTNTEIFTSPFQFPTEFHFENYKTAIEIGNIGRQFLNSMFLAIVTLALTALAASKVTFAISRLRFNGQ